jgi:hypothetical protein
MKENTAQHQTATQSHSIWLFFLSYIYFWDPPDTIKSFFYILYWFIFSQPSQVDVWFGRLNLFSTCWIPFIFLVLIEIDPCPEYL